MTKNGRQRKMFEQNSIICLKSLKSTNIPNRMWGMCGVDVVVFLHVESQSWNGQQLAKYSHAWAYDIQNNTAPLCWILVKVYPDSCPDTLCLSSRCSSALWCFPQLLKKYGNYLQGRKPVTLPRALVDTEKHAKHLANASRWEGLIGSCWN